MLGRGLRLVLTCKHSYEDKVKKAEPVEVGLGKTLRADDEGVMKMRVEGV